MKKIYAVIIMLAVFALSVVSCPAYDVSTSTTLDLRGTNETAAIPASLANCAVSFYKELDGAVIGLANNGYATLYSIPAGVIVTNSSIQIVRAQAGGTADIYLGDTNVNSNVSLATTTTLCNTLTTTTVTTAATTVRLHADQDITNAKVRVQVYGFKLKQ
jgi:hypothetical protein